MATGVEHLNTDVNLVLISRSKQVIQDLQFNLNFRLECSTVSDLKIDAQFVVEWYMFDLTPLLEK